MPIVTRQIVRAEGPDLFEVELHNEFLTVRLLNIGATLWELRRSGEVGPSLCLAMPTAADYPPGSGYIGVTAGPVANRIAGARFEIDGRRYELDANEGPHQLHGGPTGFSHKPWAADVDQNPDRVRFTLRRPDGEGGYPGNLEVSVTYALEANRVRYRWTAATDQPTPVSLTNHAYWNLAGVGTIADHTVQVPAGALVAVDQDSIPTGELMTVDGTAYDLRTAAPLGERIAQLGDGIDHCYVLDRLDVPDQSGGERSTTVRGAGRISEPVVLSHPVSGRSLTITTTLPGIQVYTGQFLNGSPDVGGHRQYAGLCLETQHLPDAVNQPSFPSCLVHPGRPVSHLTDYIFDL